MSIIGFHQFGPFTTTDRDDLDWSCGHNRIVKDITTGDELFWGWTSANNKMPMYSSQNELSPMLLVVADASGASGSQPNQIVAVDQDSNGKVHCLSADGTGHVYYYTRFSLTRSGGHVTGYSIDQAFTALPNHTADNTMELRGDIAIVTQGGVETCVWAYGAPFGTNTTYSIYGGQMSALTGTATSVGVGGTGTDTLLETHTVSGLLQNHTSQVLIGQEPTSEHIYVFSGQFCSDYAIGVAQSSDNDLRRTVLTKSGGNWSVGSTSVQATQTGTVTPPQLLCVRSVAGKCIVMYYWQNGIQFDYIDSSGTNHSTVVPIPYSTGTNSAFGVFNTDGTNYWFTANIYGVNGTSPTTGLSGYYNGSVWQLWTDPIPKGVEMYAGCRRVTDGCAAVRGAGSTLSQTSTNREFQRIRMYNPDAVFGPPPVRRRRRGKSLVQRLDVRGWM